MWITEIKILLRDDLRTAIRFAIILVCAISNGGGVIIWSYSPFIFIGLEYNCTRDWGNTNCINCCHALAFVSRYVMWSDTSFFQVRKDLFLVNVFSNIWWKNCLYFLLLLRATPTTPSDGLITETGGFTSALSLVLTLSICYIGWIGNRALELRIPLHYIWVRGFLCGARLG